MPYEGATNEGSDILLILGLEGRDIFIVRNDFQDLSLINGKWFEMEDELVGNTQDKFLDVSIRVVAGEGGGKRREAVSLAGTSSSVGEAGHEEGVLRRVGGEEADENGGNMVDEGKFLNFFRLGFRDEHIIIGWRDRPLLLSFFFHEACTRSGEEELECRSNFTALKPLEKTALGAILVSLINFIDDWLFGAMIAEFERLRILIDKLFLALGWVFNTKGEEGVIVKFLGYLVDASKREFSVPPVKVERAVAAVKRLMMISSEGREVKLDDLQSLLGTLGSMRLAIQSIPVWTRELFSPWKAGAVYEPGATVALTAPMTREMEMILSLLYQKNAGPFISQQWEVDVFVDSSEIGWGATVLGEQVGDIFPAHLIGTSSTLRELNGLLGCSRHTAVRPWLKGKVVRWNLDSTLSCESRERGRASFGPLHSGKTTLDRVGFPRYYFYLQMVTT